MVWTVEIVPLANNEIEELPIRLRAKIVRALEVVRIFGITNLRAPLVRHLEGKLWELRVKSTDGIARGIYVTVTSKKMIVLHVFHKKSRKTPRRAIETAQRRMKQEIT